MLKHVDVKDFKNNFNFGCNYVIDTNLPLIINDNSKPSFVLLSFKAYDAIEKLFEIMDSIQIDNRKYPTVSKEN